jgi:hypothetical protein
MDAPTQNPLLNPALLAQLAQQQQQTASMPPPGGMTSAPPISMPGMQAPTPNLPPPTQPNVTGPTRLHADQTELQRKQDTGSGISQISQRIQDSSLGQAHPLVGKLLGGAAQGLATLGDVGLRAVAPSVDLALPGTSLHHISDLRQGERQVAGDEANQEKEAQTRNLDLQPQLKLAQQNLNQQKQENVVQHQKDALEAQLREHNLKSDEDGQIVPLKYEEMTPAAQAIHDLKGSQEELADANAALKKAQNDPNSPAFRLAQQRVNNATQSRSVAMERLGLSEKQFEMRAHGTEGGEALPGSMIGDDGRTIGTAFQANVRPTGTQRTKGNMADSAAQQISDMKSIISKRPDIFGPLAGRTTDLQVWLGSQDPDAQRFRAARTIAGDHLAGTFGGRSAEALHALDNALGQFKDNPSAAMAGLDQLAGATKNFQKAGTVKTTGSEAAADQPLGDTTKPDGVYEMNGKQFRVKGGKVYAH